VLPLERKWGSKKSLERRRTWPRAETTTAATPSIFVTSDLRVGANGRRRRKTGCCCCCTTSLAARVLLAAKLPLLLLLLIVESKEFIPEVTDRERERERERERKS
jgi:hypothetical protein